MNTTTGIQTIRSNIFARSCNDDFCPAMEELCVKMSKLSLQSDPKMEAYDAKLEQSFYEEKDEGDEKNEETFRYNDEDEYSLEVCAFNTRYSTCFDTKKLNIFLDYVEHTGLTIEDAFNYSQSCHACGNQLKEFCGEYCNRRCSEYLECDLNKCVHGDSCLICVGYPETTCYWGPNCNDCRAYEGLEEDRYPYDCFYCLTQMTDHEGYDIDNELYCNNCAVYLFDKTGHLDDQDNDDQDNDDQDNDDQDNDDHDNDDQDSNDSKKRHIEPEEESDSKRQCVSNTSSRDLTYDLTQESYDIWELALDINNGVREAALLMIEDQPRLKSHPRVIEYYRSKKTSNAAEECSSECSSLDEDLQQRKRARHIRFEDVDDMDLDISDTESECDRCPEVMVIDLLNNSEEEDEDDDEDDVDYDYAESVVDDDSEVENLEDAAPNTVTMEQTTVSSMVTMIQELQEENAALRAELELLQSQRRMLFPEGSSISITEEDGLRYVNVHSPAPRGNHSHMSLSELDCHDDYSDTEDDFAMDEDM